MEKTMKENFANILKGTLISVLISLGLILVFAVCLKFIDLSDSIIKIINQFIKIFSIFFGVFNFLKTQKEKGFLKWFCVGLLYALIAYFVFSLLNTSISFELQNIIDFAFNGVFGMICGIFCANLKSKSAM